METIYDTFKKHGYSRRDFLKFAATISAYLGIPSSSYSAVVERLQSRPKPVVVWLEFQDCSGCSESFIRSSDILPSHLLVDLIDVEYHELLMAGAGEAAESHKDETIQKYRCDYILVVEGSVPSPNNAAYCTIGGRSSYEILEEAAKYASVIMSVGSCSSWGGLPKADPNPTHALSILEALPHMKEKIVHIPGCPPLADVMVSVIMEYLIKGRVPPLDDQRRPLSFFSQTIHDTCYRRPFYNTDQFAKSFDDEGAREGHCLYELGCKGPITRNACSTLRWNGGLSFPIQSGHPCFGCSEPDFWDQAHIYEPVSAPVKTPDAKEYTFAAATGVLLGAAVAAAAKLGSKKEEDGHV